MTNAHLGARVAHRFPLPYIVQREAESVVDCPFDVLDDSVTQSAIPYAANIYDPAGNLLLGPLTPNYESPANTGARYVTFTPSASWQLGAGYRVDWTLKYGNNVTYGTVSNEMIVARRVLSCPVSSADLYAVVSSLNPSTAKPIHGMSSLDGYVVQAWTRIQRRLIENGNRPNLILSPSALHDVTVLLSLALVFEDFATRLNAAYMEQARMYREQYEQAWSRLSFQYAADDGTTGTSNRRKSASSSIFLGTARLGNR